jgi:hypothetical protein
MTQTWCTDGSESRPRIRLFLLEASVLSEKRDYVAVGERVHMVFDVTIRPPRQGGSLPGAGLKHFMGCGE